MMTGMDGYEFCRVLRANAAYAHIPVIFLTAKDDEFDRVLGLELGADDYVSKPFSLKELMSRIKAVLRRTSPEAAPMIEGERISVGGVVLDPIAYSLTVDKEDVRLTKTEFFILHLFMKYPGKIFSRDNIIDSVRGQDVYIIDRTIDVHIMNIRKKLKKYKNHIVTFSGIGYGFREP
jgi:DNA-binding response OmpR family regulator